VLAVGMTAILVLTVQGAPLTAAQTLWLSLFCVALAGICAWLIGQA
jgi:hypothetical protein